jgi:hypothetical protein
MFEVPPTVKKPWRLIQECDLLVDIINEAVDNSDLGKWSYPEFLDYIEGIMESPEKPMARARPKFPPELERKSSSDFEREQVSFVLGIGDAIAARQLNSVLGP